jgi:glucose-6-phosphate isomerase
MDTDALAGLRDLLGSAGRQDYTLEVISKSGGTLETAVVFRLFLADLLARHGEGARDRVVVTTEPGSPLHRLAEQLGFATFTIPKNVGGRYSVLTPVGLLPAAIAGIDLQALLEGAAQMAAACESPDVLRNPAYLYATLQYLGYRERGWSVSVMAVWAKQLEAFGLWHDQLCAESLGKDQIGRTPLTSVNTRDLHSRGQQHQEGAPDKLITNLFVCQPAREPIVVPPLAGNPDGLEYLRGRPLHDLLRTAARATRFAYHEAGRPTLDLWLRDLSPTTLGQLIYLFELATVVEGKLLAINPLDQPGVEAYKNTMFGLLGRPDRAEYRARFEARTPDREEYVCGDPSLPAHG